MMTTTASSVFAGWSTSKRSIEARSACLVSLKLAGEQLSRAFLCAGNSIAAKVRCVPIVWSPIPHTRCDYHWCLLDWVARVYLV